MKKHLLLGVAFLAVIGTIALAQQPGVNRTLNAVFAVPIDNKAPTFGAGIRGLVAASAATDIYTICGSATRIIRVSTVYVAGRATSAASVDVSIVLRSTANVGGTATVVSIQKYDSTYANATASASVYTVNPTIGTPVGATGAMLATKQLFLGNLTTGQPGEAAQWTFGNRPSSQLVLRGVAQCMSINLNAQTASGNLMEMAVEWTENPN